jgi:hypothetical protein
MKIPNITILVPLRIITCLFVLLTVPVLAQQAVLPASSNATGTGGSASYSVGQTTFKTQDSQAGTVTQGVQQPYEILFMTGVDDKKAASLTCKVYPNPVAAELTLKIEAPVPDDMNYEVRNELGAIVGAGKAGSEETVITVSGLPAGMYVVILREKNEQKTTWKVIKK